MIFECNTDTIGNEEVVSASLGRPFEKRVRVRD